MPTQLIINADDFGSSLAVNRAVARAHREGVLTSASLMVTGDAVRDAVRIARDLPQLAVGLHLVLSQGKPKLPECDVHDLVGVSGRFPADPVKAALRYYFSHKARRQLRVEIEAQFDAFTETGLPLSHVDGHQHLHAHPAVLPIVIELAMKHGAHGIRVPHDPLGVNMRADRSRPASKLAVALGHRYLERVCRRSLENKWLVRCDAVIGTLMSGRMSDEYVIRMLSSVPGQSIEVFFHPSDDSASDPWGPNPGDLLALLSTRLRHFIQKGDYQLATYARLARAGRGEADDHP